MVGIVTMAMILLYRLQDSRIGRAWKAIREDELAAAANGINTVTTKLLAFALGATTAGLAGVFNASKLTIVSPGPVLVHGVVHGPGHGHPRRHGQHLGRRRRCVHRLPDPGGPAQAAQHDRRGARTCPILRTSTSSTTSTCSTASRWSVMMLFAPGGPVPEPETPAASCTSLEDLGDRSATSRASSAHGRDARCR